MSKYEGGKFRSVIIDTINGLQNSLHLELLVDKGKATYDEWRDYGTDILSLYNFIKKLPDTVIVQILGYEGTGKTVGGKTLNEQENVWLNTDGKPLSFFGARGRYNAENKNYYELSKYEQVKEFLTAIHAKRKGTLVVFILGHLEDFKGEDQQIRQRLKILGKMATKLGIEGLNVSHTYYTKVDTSLGQNDPNRYQLMTANSGLNTARSPEGYWNSYTIQNNYQSIVDKILEDYGESEPKETT